MYQAQQNGANKDGKRMENPIFIYYAQYHVDVVAIDPWHFSICWRSIFNDVLWNFVFNMQIVNENEVECIDIIFDLTNSLEKQRIDENHKIRPHFKKFFHTIASHLAKASANADAHTNSNEASNSLRVKFINKGDFIVFVSEMTQCLITLSVHFTKVKSASTNN